MSFAAAFESYRDKEKRVEKWVELFLTAVPEQKRGVLLDCGCGVGRFSVPLASSFEMVIGIDIDETMLSIARKRTNDVQWIHGNICCTPLNNDSVDVVLASMLIEHLKSFRSFQKEIFRLIKPAGILLMRTMLPEDIAATTWYQFSETAYKMECSRTHDLAWIVQNMAEYGFVLDVNALLGCHNLALSCCHEIARISVMECSFCDGADSRPITKGISSCIHALPAL